MSARTGPDLRLAPVALTAWITAWALTSPGSAHAAVVAVGAVGTAILLLGALGLRRLRGRGRRSASRWCGPVAAHLLLALACAGAIAACVHVQAAARAPVALAGAGEAVATLTGTVVTEPRPARFDAGATWSLAVEQITARGLTTTARGHVEVTAPGSPPRYGSRVVARVRLGPPGIGAGVVATAAADQPVAEVSSPGVLLAGTDRMRHALLEVTDPLSVQARGLVPGAAIGDTTRVPDDLDEAMKISGLTHVTAVSGSHFAIVLAVVTALLVTCRVPRWARIVLLAVTAVAFVVLVRPEPSVLRAAWTCGVGLLALALGRPAAGPAALATASTLLLAVDPWQSRSFGFALSCAATAGIVLLTGPLSRRLAPWCGRAVAFALAVPVAAQAACGPVLVLLDPAVPVAAVPANVLAAPALVPATVLGLAATVLAPWAPGAATAVAWLAGLPTGWIAAVATFFAGLPGARLPWWSGPLGALALAVATAVVLAVLLGRPPGRGRSRWSPGPDRTPRGGLDAARRVLAAGVRKRAPRPATVRERRWDRLVPVAAVVLVATACGAAALIAPRLAATNRTPADWQVVACDVGQGDTVVVRSGPRSAVVVDAGPPGSAADGCLDRLGVQHIDLLVLSHFHTDHVGGLDAVVAGRRVDRALVSAVRDPAAPADRALQTLRGAGIATDVGSAGQRGTAGSVTWQVLGADADTGANDSSVTVALRTADDVDVVLLGDLEEAGQERLVDDLRAAGFPHDPLEVVKMAHHGSASQSADLARLLAPDVVLVTVGDNDYGHPTRSALDLYAGVGAQVVRTDECGTALMTARAGALGLACQGF